MNFSLDKISQLFELYQKELIEDLQLNEVNAKEKQMILPALKHKWVARLIKHKREIKRLEKEKQNLVKTAVEEAKAKKTGVPEKIIVNQFLSKSQSVSELEEIIVELDTLIQYLERVEQIFKSLTYDIKNLIDLIKLETL